MSRSKRQYTPPKRLKYEYSDTNDDDDIAAILFSSSNKTTMYYNEAVRTGDAD